MLYLIYCSLCSLAGIEVTPLIRWGSLFEGFPTVWSFVREIGQHRFETVPIVILGYVRGDMDLDCGSWIDCSTSQSRDRRRQKMRKKAMRIP